LAPSTDGIPPPANQTKETNMTAKIRELNLEDIKTVAGGVVIPTKQQVIAHSANVSVSLPSGINAALAMSKAPAPIR
jgi:hypothetical protein